MRKKEDTKRAGAGWAQQLCMQAEPYRFMAPPGSDTWTSCQNQAASNINPFGIEIIDDFKILSDTGALQRPRPSTRHGRSSLVGLPHHPAGFLLRIPFAASLFAFRLPCRHGERGTRRRSEHARPPSSRVQPACCRRYAHPAAPARRRQHQRPRHPSGYSHSCRSRRGWR